jgi:hypothetical protein
MSFILAVELADTTTCKLLQQFDLRLRHPNRVTNHQRKFHSTFLFSAGVLTFLLCSEPHWSKLATLYIAPRGDCLGAPNSCY